MRLKPIPEYLEADEVSAIIGAAPNPKGEAADAGAVAGWASCVRGARPRSRRPVARHTRSHDQGTVRQGGKARLVPVHPELHGALGSALA